MYETMVYRRLNYFINFLNDSKLVFNVQSYFGIEVLHKHLSNGTAGNTDANIRSIGSSDVTKKEQLDSKHDAYKYRINNKFFYLFFSFVTHLGSEIFYIIFLPLLMWLYDERITYLTCLSWAVSMYLGQVTKEIFCMPRPSTPPVVKLDKQYINEYGFPSTHAMAAMSISFTFLTLLFNSNEQIQFKYSIVLLASLLCVLIGLSRIYLGMHSLLDVIGGLVYSYVISSLFVPYTSAIDQLLANGLLYGIGFYCIGILLCLAYPTINRDSSARTDTFIIIGVASGLCLGIALKNSLEMPINQFSLKLFNTVNMNLVVYRIIVGCIATFVTRLVCKQLIFSVALNIFNCKRYFRANETPTPKELVIRKYPFEFMYYFLTYSCVSFTVIFISSALFQILKLN